MNNLYVVQIDAIHANVPKIPSNVIAVAGYVTGSPDIVWTQEDWNRFPLASHVTIDQSPSLAKFAAGEAIIADVEPRAGTISAVMNAARQRASRGQDSPVYLSFDWLDLARQTASVMGLANHMRYWVADYSWSETGAINFMEANGDVMAVQFASPSSNPNTKVPGSTSGATLSVAQCDLSIKRADWWPAPSVAATGWRE